MNNPVTIDRRDVAHSTNPIGGKAHVEEIDKPNASRPLDARTVRLPAGGNNSAGTAIPSETRDELRENAMPDGVPPARSDGSVDAAEPPAPQETNPARLDQIRAEGRKTSHVQSPQPQE